jgi:kinesin family protein C2/C3
LQTGPNGASEEDWGVNYRALNDLFSISQNRRDSLIYEIQVQMVEIYNEQVRDLLLSDGSQKKYPLQSSDFSSGMVYFVLYKFQI